MPSISKKEPIKESPNPALTCGFCKKTYKTEAAFMVHLCVGKQRDLERDEKHARYGLQIFRRFYEVNHRTHAAKTWDDFIRSTFYNDFIKVGRYIATLNAVNAPSFVTFLVKSGLPVKKWTSPSVYETFIHELTKKETPETAVERNILLMQQWATQTENRWEDFFVKIAPSQATIWITTGRISPWVFYVCATSDQLLMRMSDEQLMLAGKYLDPSFWDAKIKQYPEEVAAIKAVFRELGV